MENIIISNPEKLEKLKKAISNVGLDKLHILADFDRTLTHAFVNGEKVRSIISVLRSNKKYLGEDYIKKANALYEKYYPIETDLKIFPEEKKRKMEEWWWKHFDLLINLGFKKSHLDKITASEKIRFRQGALEFFDFLHKHRIPLVIMSASGVGGDIIPRLFKKENRLYSNVHIISNFLIWDREGKAIGLKKPIIHAMNKDETVVRDFPYYEKIKNRKNVLLLGDNLEDTGMIKGFDYDNLIKIGFLNENVEEKLEQYKRNYDVVILNDSSMDYINKLLTKISAST